MKALTPQQEQVLKELAREDPYIHAIVSFYGDVDVPQLLLCIEELSIERRRLIEQLTRMTEACVSPVVFKLDLPV